MPIEIRELVIRATVGAGESGGSASPSGDGHQPPDTHAPSEDEIVQACVREVLFILESKQER